MDSLAILYKVYVKTNDSGVIIVIDSDAFITDTTGWTEIDSGYTDKYHHAQTQYLENSLIDTNGVFNYKLVDGVVTERTDEEKAADIPEIEVPIPMYNTTVSNPNLLINPDFKINQRGQMEYTDVGYTVDNWYLDAAECKLTVNDEYISLTRVVEATRNPGLQQTIRCNIRELAGKDVTFSACYRINTIYAHQYRMYIGWTTVDNVYTEIAYSPNYTIVPTDGEWTIAKFTATIPEDVTVGGSLIAIIRDRGYAAGVSQIGDNIDIKYTKLELGPVATPFVTPNSAEELLKIQSMDGGGISKLISDSTLPTIMNSQMVGNPNILINSNFKINQRGQTIYKNSDYNEEGTFVSSTNKYSVDRWKMVNGDATQVEVIDNGVKIGYNPDVDISDTTVVRPACFTQYVENPAYYVGKTLTASMYVSECQSNYIMIHIAYRVGSTWQYSSTVSTKFSGRTNFIMQASATIPENVNVIAVQISGADSRVGDTSDNYSIIKWVKLEESNIPTAYNVPDYATELAKCYRYFYRYTSINSNSVFLMATQVPSNKKYTNAIITVPVTMRVVPTITISGSTKIVDTSNTEYTPVTTKVIASDKSLREYILVATFSNEMTSDNVLHFIPSGTYIDFSAEL